MRNKGLKIIFGLIISLILFPAVVKAELTCDNSTVYNVKLGTFEYVKLNHGYIYPMRLYDTSTNGVNIKSYCIEPVLKTPKGINYCERRIDPSNSSNGLREQAYDVAVTKAYELLVRDGRNTTSSEDRILGETLFRWLGSNFGTRTSDPAWTLQCYTRNGEVDNTCSGNPIEIYSSDVNKIFNAPFTTDYWNTGEYNYVISVFHEAASIGNKILYGTATYEELVANGEIWSDQYNYKTSTKTDGNIDYVTVELDAINDIQNIYWPEFKGGCTNSTVKCTTWEATGTGKSGKVVIQVSKTANYDNQDYGIYVDSSIYDIKSSSSNMIIVKSRTNPAPQRILLVVDAATAISNPGTSIPRGGSSIKINPSCVCETDASGNYTGKYKVKDKNGNTFPMDYTDSRKDQYGCPDSSTCVKKPDNTCKKPSESDDGKYHCKDGEVCTEEEYKKQCTHHCQTPEESGDGEYYCSESSPGAGDGPKCNKNLYESECLGKPNCTPTIEMPSGCKDFGSNKIEGTADGIISDINIEENSCNPNANEIKQCVIDNTDLRGDSPEYSFQNKSEQAISENPYCKVWCEERFNFEMPTAKLSDSGGYFTLETKVSGTRNCYISGADDPTKGIDEAKFNSDLANKQKEVIDAWNEYNYWKTAADAEYHEENKTASQGTCHAVCGQPPNEESCDSPGAGPEDYTYVWMKWSAVQYNYDGYTKPNKDGSYSDGSGSCGCSSCSIDNGSDPRAGYREKRDSAKSTLETKIKELNDIIVQYNNCTGTINNTTISDLIKTDANSTGWDNDFDFDPIVTYNYNQDYINKMTGKMEEVPGSGISGSDYMYCTGDTDNKYNCTSGGQDTIPTKKLRYFKCNDKECSWDETTINISTAKWIRKTKTNTDVVYRPNNNFSTYTQYGTIRFNKDENEGNSVLLTKLPSDAMPISLITKSGVFPFVITYSNIGQSNSTGEADGRLIGKSTSVLTEFNKLPSSEKCTKTDVETMEQNVGYVCHYLNNCKDDCDFECDDDNNCEFTGDNCDDGYCKLTCENCIFDGDKNTYSYRTVSLNKLFPNERTGSTGYNWNKSIKGQVTQREIEENSDTIYETPEYSFTLTPNNLKNIRDYNDQVGSYTNNKTPDKEDAMTCTNVDVNGLLYPVKCNSTFLDMVQGLQNSDYNFARYKNKYAQSDNVIRPEKDERFILADQLTDSNGKLLCPNFNCVSRNNYIGPAWK